MATIKQLHINKSLCIAEIKTTKNSEKKAMLNLEIRRIQKMIKNSLK